MILARLDLAPPLQDALDRPFLGNPLENWLRAAIVLVAAFLALGIAKRLLVARLEAIAQRTSTDIDDLVVDLIRRTRRWFLVVVALYLAHHFVEIPREDSDGDGTPDRVSRWEGRIGMAVNVAVWIQVGLWGRGVLQFGIARLIRGSGPADAGSAIGSSVLSFVGSLVLWTLVLLLCLEALSVNVNSLIASLGVGGIAVALAAQNVLGDLFASIAILLDKPFVVGDSVQVGDFVGDVERIGVKTTRLRSVNGEEIVMGNSDLIAARIRNFKRLQHRRVVCPIGVTYDTPHERLTEIPQILREIVAATPGTRFDRAHFRSFGDSALQFELVYFTLTKEFGQMADIQQAINLEIVARFEREGIEFAFPTRTLHVVHAGAGAAPAGKATARGPRRTSPGATDDTEPRGSEDDE